MWVEGVECPESHRGQDWNVLLILAFAVCMELFASTYVSGCFGVRLSMGAGCIKDRTGHGAAGLYVRGAQMLPIPGSSASGLEMQLQPLSSVRAAVRCEQGSCSLAWPTPTPACSQTACHSTRCCRDGAAAAEQNFAGFPKTDECVTSTGFSFVK